ncbi:ricin-type beta-trefoil lectin protein [Streptomyces sp. TLI_235]|nr:ricin-type beta-trefoil lectin protein [Streptomyces sp. TLI_235]
MLVVKDAQAAANPALKTLALGTATKGLTVTADPQGAITAAGADGKPAFRAPAPVMWDSAASPVAAKALAAPSASDTAPSGSSTDGPGKDAHVKPIAVKAGGGALSLTPDADLLGGKGTDWPLYIDPSFQPAPTMGTSHFAQVMQGCPGSPKYDDAQPNGEGVGFQHYVSNCYGFERSYYEFGTGALTKDMYIDSARAYFTQSYSAAWSCSHTAPVTLKWTGRIDGTTSWNNRPGERWTGETKSIASVAGSCGNNPGVDFDVTGALRQVVQDDQPLTVGLFGDESGNTGADNFMRFATNPTVVATYDIAPYTPDANYTSPDAVYPNGAACGGGQVGWIGRTATLGNGASDITLHAYGRTPMSGTNITVNFHIWDNMVADANGNPATAAWPVSQAIAQAGWGAANVGGPVSDGHQYGWNAWTTDGLLSSPGGPFCYFNVDLTAPTLAEIAPSSTFPPTGSGLKPTGHAGDPGSVIRVTSTDPVPGGCTRGSCMASGVHEFQYALDDNIPVTGYQQVNAYTGPDGVAYADLPISLNADQWGSHRLYVRAVDWAGNTQPQAATYDFYAPWNPATKVVAGDADGDATPDYLLPSANGDLTLLPGNSDFKATPGLASTAARSPKGDSWNNYLLAHRGSITDDSMDDLIAYSKADKQLYVYLNDAYHVPQGTSGHFTFTSRQSAASAQLCSPGIDNTWNNISQLTAVSAAPHSNGRANLVTVENGHLRWYSGSTVSGCDFNPGIELGAAGEDWSGFTLLSPGLVGGTPALWVRDALTGAVSQLPLALTNGSPAANSLHAPAHKPLVSAVKDAAGQNMCADIDHGWTSNNTGALLFNCADNSPNQQLTQGTDGSLHVLGKCLDVSNAATGNGSWVNLFDCNNTVAQKWVAGPYPGTLENPNAQKCLADPAGDNTPGNHLIIWDCLNNASQQWISAPTAATVLPIGLSQVAYPTVDSPGDVNGDDLPDLLTVGSDSTLTQYLGTAAAGGSPQLGAGTQLNVPAPVSYNFNSMANPTRCLDNWGPSEGGALRFYNCWNGASQKFTFATDGTLRSGNLCVSVQDDRTDNGAPVVMASCRGTTGQIWTLKPDGVLYNPKSARAIELPGWNDANGTALSIWDYLGPTHTNQRWTMFTNTA